MELFNGMGMGLQNLSLLSDAKTRSISAENFNGEKGKGGMATEGTMTAAARELGVGWKVSPCVSIEPNTTFTVANIEGSGVIQHMWFTTGPELWRSLIIRIYWDGETEPSVCSPIGDFFCNGWCEPVHINSLPISVNPRGGFNSYFEMPFRKSARIEVENISPDQKATLFYQVTYTITNVPDQAAYFHAQFKRTNPVPYKEDYTIVEGIKGKGHYIGTYLAWQANSNGWWGEGEIKFFMDGDKQYPTICGTGVEDYFGGAWGFETVEGGEYDTYSTPFLGFPQATLLNQQYRVQKRFGLYRWHIMDPIRFDEDLKVTIQAIGWRSGGRYLPLQDDIASVAYWYQSEPHQTFPEMQSRDELEVI